MNLSTLEIISELAHFTWWKITRKINLNIKNIQIDRFFLSILYLQFITEKSEKCGSC